MTAYGYLYNLQGDVVALVNGAGTKVVEYTCDAWGVQLTRTGTMANSLGKIQPFRYRGYVYDEESGLYYLRSRYYRPGWGRFVSADALVKGNLYSYCNNAPIICHDDDGKSPLQLTKNVKDSNKNYPDEILCAEEFVSLILQAVTIPEWEYVYGFSKYLQTDCVGLPKYVLNWYYNGNSFRYLFQITKGRNKGKILNQVKDLAIYGMQNGKTYDIDNLDEIPIGTAVFIYNPNDSRATKQNKGWIHVGIFIGGTDEYKYTVAAAGGKEEGVGFFELTNEYTKWGYFEGVGYK